AALRFTAAADTYVNSLHPEDGNGRAAYLRVNGHPRRSKWVYLRFSVSGLPQPALVARATLRLKARRDAPGATVAVYHVASDDWREHAVNWRERPAPDASALDSRTGMVAGEWQEWDVTAAVGGNGRHSFALGRVQPVNGDVDWSSREDGAGAPELVIEFSPP
ncbi:MAG TPA: DNRLRE domain-containing protein, partial [Vicinamibacteria bacterium]